MNTVALINEAISLPVEERALVVESLLQSLNRPETGANSQWAMVAQKRLNALQNGTVEALNGDDIFSNIWRRFNQ